MDPMIDLKFHRGLTVIIRINAAALINFLRFRCGVYLRAAFSRGRRLLQNSNIQFKKLTIKLPYINDQVSCYFNFTHLLRGLNLTAE